MTEAAPRLAFGIGPDGTYTRAGQTIAFVLGLLTMIAFVPLLVVGALLYTHGEARFARDPESARRFVTWSWVALAAPVALGMIAVPLLILLG